MLSIGIIFSNISTKEALAIAIPPPSAFELKTEYDGKEMIIDGNKLYIGELLLTQDLKGSRSAVFDENGNIYYINSNHRLFKHTYSSDYDDYMVLMDNADHFSIAVGGFLGGVDTTNNRYSPMKSLNELSANAKVYKLSNPVAIDTDNLIIAQPNERFPLKVFEKDIVQTKNREDYVPIEPYDPYHKNYFVASESDILSKANDKRMEELTYGEINSIYKQMVAIKLENARENEMSSYKSFYQMIDEILSQIIDYGMTPDEKIKAVYDFLVYNFVHEENGERRPSNKQVSYTFHEAPNLFGAHNMAYALLRDKEGICYNFAYLFEIMLFRMDIVTETVSGDFVNRDGSKASHYWNRVYMDNAWHWYDVDIDGSTFRKGSSSNYFLYKKDTKYWKTNHEWDEKYYKDMPPVLPKPDTPSEWAYDDVYYAIWLGLVPDDLQRKYTQAITRVEFCALAVRLYETLCGEEITERYKRFSDSSNINVMKMAGIGVVPGNNNSNYSFAPFEKLTRENAAILLVRLVNSLGKPLEQKPVTFADNKDISSEALTAVGQVYAANIMGGVGNNNFNPQGVLTREQSIIILLRIYNTF